jgi:DNA-binding transcriptional ArsR family regulator
METDPQEQNQDILSAILPLLRDPPARKNIDPQMVKALWERGYTSGQIGKALKISRPTVFYHLNNLRDHEGLDRHYQDNEGKVMVNLRRRLLTSISDDEIKKTPPPSRILSACQLFDKQALLEGKSTSNIFIAHAQAETLKPARNILSEIKTLTSSDDSLVGDNLTDE